ncbi:MAG: DUF3656 domain-containing protein [Erysipelotrichales bacterium]|nr:DUF3656 domain-containing protein [Erysipelotrichales bacterium]
MKKPEILAPAGNKEAFYAAIAAGADAIYLGGPKFNAREAADNFSLADFKEMITYAHLREVKIYLTLNTLLFEDELPQAILFLDEVYLLGIDAVIIQDLGLLKRISDRYPNLDIHASTQLSVDNLDSILFLEKYNVKRVVLAREVDLETIKQLRKQTSMEIEVFIHGALCISYSGGCLFSSFVGKRSGNRGRCAQPCRLPYKLNKENGYFLSPKDLCALDYYQELIEAGIDSWKIEGRLKSPEYVYVTVNSYKELVMGQNLDINLAKQRISRTFARKFTKGLLFKETKIINPDSPNHIGIKVGKVLEKTKAGIKIELNEVISLGDGLRIVGKESSGFWVQAILSETKERLKEAQANQIVYLPVKNEVSIGDEIFKTTDSLLKQEIKYKIEKTRIKFDIDASITENNSHYILELNYGKKTFKSGISKRLEIMPLNQDRFFEQIRKTGDTVYRVQNIKTAIQEVYLSIADVNSLRRDALQGLDDVRLSRPKRAINHNVKIKELVLNDSYKKGFLFHCENELAVKTIKKILPEAIIFYNGTDFTNLAKTYPDLKQAEKRKEAKKHAFVNELGSISENVVTSPYLNIINSAGVELLLENGVSLVGLSYELSFKELKELIANFFLKFKKYPPVIFPIYGYVDLMLTKACLFRNKCNTKCLSCQERKVKISDRLSYQMKMIKEETGLTRIINSKRLYLLDKVEQLKKVHVEYFFLFFTDESEEEIKQILGNLLYGDNHKITDITSGHFAEKIL